MSRLLSICALSLLLTPSLLAAQGGVGYVIERIELRGNDRTDPTVILRSLEFEEGDRLTATGIEDSRRALQRTRLFRTVHVASKPGSQQGTAVIMVYVEEKRFGDIGLSLEYTELDGFGFSADAYHVNLWGQGRVVGGRYGVGERFRYWGLSYSHPWLSGSGLSLHVRTEGSRADRDMYREKNPNARGAYELERIGGGLGLGQRLGDNHRVIFSYSYEEVEVEDIDPPTLPVGGTPYSGEVQAAAGTAPTALFSIDIHSRGSNQPFGTVPGTDVSARGDFSTDLIGSTGDYVRLRLSAYHHVRTLPGQILTIGGRAGFVAGEPPFYERFYLDGENQLRGFERRDIAPEGGERLLSGELVYSLSLGDLGRGYLFAEAAGIWHTTGGQTVRQHGGSLGVGILLFNRVDISVGITTGVLMVKSHRFGGINVGL